MAATVVAVTLSGCLPIGGGPSDCPVIAPRELPSGAEPGSPTEGVAGGTKQFVWGEGKDLVDLRLSLSYRAPQDPVLHEVKVRGNPGVVYRLAFEDHVQPILTWVQEGCDYTVFLDPSIDAETLAAYASRY